MTVEFIDHVVRDSLTSLVDDIFGRGWYGREYEAVSYYAFGHLQTHCRADTPFYHPTQIALETCVPGVPTRNPKGRVNKDLVIWPEAGMTLWNKGGRETNWPLAVLEWKVFRPGRAKAGMSQYDLNWLTDFSAIAETSVAYAISLDLSNRQYRLSVTRAWRGSLMPRWLHLG